jgi:pimeloyl-ACP methyl ester carboxylesterase
MQVPLTLTRELDLDRPVFMGCSIGGHLAADLACDHPGMFRAIIALEGALCTPARRDLTPLHHPRVSNEYRASLMYGIMSPESPEACRCETAWVYAQGAPGVFKGDLYYYTVDHDLTQQAARIDTTQTRLYVLTGEYNWSSTPAMGQALAVAVPGATPAPWRTPTHLSREAARCRLELWYRMSWCTSSRNRETKAFHYGTAVPGAARVTNTGHGTRRITFSATLPISR